MLKIFLSYSVADRDLLLEVAETVRSSGCEVLCWEESREPGKEVWPSIFRWIDQCDLVIAIITDRAVKRAMAVGQEIGHARALRKKIIPLVGPDVAASELGCLQGVVYQQIDRDDLAPCLAVVEAILRQVVMKEEMVRHALVVIGLIVAAILLSRYLDRTPPGEKVLEP